MILQLLLVISTRGIIVTNLINRILNITVIYIVHTITIYNIIVISIKNTITIYIIIILVENTIIIIRGTLLKNWIYN